LCLWVLIKETRRRYCLEVRVSSSGVWSVEPESRKDFFEKSIGSLWSDSSASTVASRRMLRSRVTASSTGGDDALHRNSTVHRHRLSLLIFLLYFVQEGKGKGKGDVNFYSASSRTLLTRSDMVHTMLLANNTISACTRKHSPGSATTHIRIANSWVQLTTHLLTPKCTNGWRVGWHTADGFGFTRTPWRRPRKVRRSQTDVQTTVLRHEPISQPGMHCHILYFFKVIHS